MRPNLPTPESALLGAELARFADAEAVGKVDQRCETCAFRAGTYPNGCATTIMDALKATLEREPFFCHEIPADGSAMKACGGWKLLMASGGPAVEVPWGYSTEPDPYTATSATALASAVLAIGAVHV